MLESQENTKNCIVKVIGNTPEEIDGVEYKNANVVLYDGVEYIVSHKAILTINCTCSCNANCPFCYNGITFTGNGKFIETNDENLKKVIEFAQLAGVQVISFSGGEPTLLPQKLYTLAVETLPLFKEGRLHTNGFGLFSEIVDSEGCKKPLIEALVNAGLFGCSISLAHYDQVRNAEIMRFNGSFDGLSDDELATLATLKSEQFSPRLSCFMLDEGIDNVSEILTYIDFGIDKGFDNFMFRASTKIPNEHKKIGEFEDGNEKAVNEIDSIVDELMYQHDFREIFSLHKSDAHMHVLKKNGITLTIDQSAEELDPDGKIRRLIYMPNGVSYRSWLDPSELLFDKDRDKILNEHLNESKNHGLESSSCPAYVISNSVKERLRIIIAGKRFPVDLHIHTTNSDGNEDYRTILGKASANGVHTLAFAEHNSIVANYDVVRKTAAGLGVEIMAPAVEISTVFHNSAGNPERKFHVLGYGNGLLTPEFQNYISLPNQIKLNYFRFLVERLEREHNFGLPSVEDMMKGIESDGSYKRPYCEQITRTTIAEYISKVTGKEIVEIKRSFLPQISPEESYSKRLDTDEVVQRIRDLGGVAGIAHPSWARVYEGYSKTRRRLFEILFLLKRRGMHGIESMNRYCDMDEKLRMYNFANDIGLIILGGSDYHAKGETEIGMNGLTEIETDCIREILSKSS